MEPGSPAFGHWADPEQAAPRAAEVCSRWRACTRLLQFLQRPIGTESASSRTHLPQVDLELLGQGLELELAAAVRAARREGRFELRSTSPVGAMRWPWRPWASPLRLPGFAGSSFGSPLENGRPGAFPNGGLGEQPLQLCDTGITLGKARLTLGQAVVQLPELGGVGLEKPAKLSDLSDQLLVGVGFSAEDVMRAGIPNNTFRVCSGGGPRYPSTSSLNTWASEAT